MSIAVIVAVGAGVAGVTGAFYSDTETSEGNIFTAGSIDLKVDHLKQTYNGVDCETCRVTLYSADGNTEVVNGSDNATEQGFPFAAPEITPHSNWATHSTSSWVWATAPTAVGDDGSNGDVSYTFERTFQWNGTAGNIDFELGVGADNEYEVRLNTVLVDSDTSEDNYSSIDTGDFSSNLVNGENTLQIIVTNQENNNGANNPNSNPGGLLYYLEIERQDCIQGVDGFQDQCRLWQEKDLDDSETFFNFGDIKPGDYGSNVISLHVFDNDAFSCLVSHNGVDDENGVMEPEQPDTDEFGEVQNYINFFAWIDGEGNDTPNGEYDYGETELGTSTLGELSSLASFDGDNNLTATSTAYVGLKWCAGDFNENGTCNGNGMLNDAQSDSYISDLTAYAVQTRNNEQFSCGDIDASELPGYVAPTNSDLN